MNAPLLSSASSQRNIRLFYWLNFFTDLRFYAPIAIIYFSQVAGSYALGLSVFSVVMLSAAAGEIPTGIFSDFIGRKGTVVLGTVTSTAAVFCYAYGLNYGVLVLGAICEGVSRSFYSGNNEALLYDTLADSGEQGLYADLLGKTSSMFQVSAAIASLAGGLIAQWSFTSVFWISVLSQLACVVISLGMREPAHAERHSANVYAHLRDALGQFYTNRRLRLLSLASILSYGIGESAWMFRSVFNALFWPVWALGLAQTVSNVGAATSYYLSGRLIRRFKEINLLLAGELCSRAANLLALMVPTVVSPALMTTSSVMFGVSRVSENNLFQKEFSDSQRATMASLNSLAGNLFFGVFAVGLGVVADAWGPIPALIAAELCMLLVTAIYLRLYFRHRTG